MPVRIEDELLLMPTTPVPPCFLNIIHVFVLLSVHGFCCGIFVCVFGVGFFGVELCVLFLFLFLFFN